VQGNNHSRFHPSVAKIALEEMQTNKMRNFELKHHLFSKGLDVYYCLEWDLQLMKLVLSSRASLQGTW